MLTSFQLCFVVWLYISLAGASFFDWYGPKKPTPLSDHTVLTRRAERPRLSSLLVLLLSGAICFAAGYFSKWLPGADGRFAASRHQGQGASVLDTVSDEALLKGSSSHLPNRPRRYSLPALICCIVLRLETFHRVNYQQQCASPGLESFLCLLLIGYEVFSSRRRWGVPVTEDADDPWRGIFDDLYDWFAGPRVTMVVMIMSAGLFSTGTYFSVAQITRSTYICFSPVDSRLQTTLLQLVGLVLDATIIILLWRVLAWTRTTKLRLRMLGSVLFLSSVVVAILWFGGTILSGTRRFNVAFGSLYGFDVLVDSVAFASLVVSSAFWVCETSPITPASVVTFLVGTWSSSMNVLTLGDWMHNSRAGSLLPLWLIAFGAVLFTYTHDLRSVIFVRRVLLTLLFMALLIAATIVTFARRLERFDQRHPINDLIYDAQTRHDRWLVQATTSKTLPAAVKIYEERHSGRAPPPNFAEWYQFASGSVIVDEFKQIDKDLAPFWGFSPADLRKRADAMAAQPGVDVIKVSSGEVSKSDAGDDGRNLDLGELVEMIKKFSRHLPDMVLPINLGPTPRILPSWRDVQLQGRADLSSVVDLISKRSSRDLNQTVSTLETRDGQDASNAPAWELTWASDFRQMQIDACPPDSRIRTSPHWNIGQFCWGCVKAHSRGQLLSDVGRSLDICAQPDLKYLHSFSMTDPRSPPIRQLLPLFGASKTDDFRDILIPLPRSTLEKPDVSWQFSRRYDNLFWRASVGEHAINEQALRGSHKFRLLHLIKSPNPQDRVTMILPVPGEEHQFRPEKLSAAEASNAIPFSAGINDYSACLGNNCELLKHAFGTEADTEEALEYRYVLLTDEDDGPPGQVLRTIRSGSVPFVSSIFRTWYTERLEPWLHFVPVDVRYHALHTTFSYFTGTENRPKMKGRDTAMKGRENDAEWISQQGQRWAEKALAKKDMEIYLFRLLLEWGRLIDDGRGDIGYRQGQDGEFQNDGWTQADR
ncbi:Beta-1,2-xylosyltransferase 1 [Tolypocladium paradoxum]|uniref:Beta-1,2-xylosyltransferase 1 n=1 Tax=Tolypocladium paradoxum TaxID=94208 RepID=A0A2S4L025_9HYPO|nr:Beta-1,2-xylosyltransferase 1 [Tolypocladium paradoxum]